MSQTAVATLPELLTLEDLLHHLGDVPADRVRLNPVPGASTEADLLEIRDREGRLYELVEGVLVEKGMGFFESRVAVVILVLLEEFTVEHDLGVVAGADGMMRLTSGLVRIPDVSFIDWNQLPGRQLPAEAIPDLYPDLAVEVLSRSNTPGEMERKRREYFAAGCTLVWQVHPQRRTIDVYTSPDEFTTVDETGTLDGGHILPGFSVAVAEIFASAERRPR